MEREDIKLTLAISRRRSFFVLPGRSRQVTCSVSKSLRLQRNCRHLHPVYVLSKSLLRFLENEDDQKALDSVI